MEEILIEVDERGNVQVEANGFVGPDCKTLTAQIEAELGETTTTVQKPEFRRARAIGRKVGA